MNRQASSTEIATFVRVIERGGFAAAADEFGLTPSGVSKVITRLEDRLGVKLIQRTTRRLVLTPEGETLLARGRDILASIDATVAEVTAARGKPKGIIRVNSGTAFAKHKLVRHLGEFLERFPDITLELSIADRRVDVINDQFDVVIRTGRLEDSSLHMRKLGVSTRVIVGSPAYLKRRGTPVTAEDLARHTCLAITGLSRLSEWPLRTGDRVSNLSIKAAIFCDSADILRDMAIAGIGLVRLSHFMLDDAIADGRLVPVLEDVHVSEVLDIAAVMPPGRQLWPRVRVFLDFVAEKMRTDPMR